MLKNVHVALELGRVFRCILEMFKIAVKGLWVEIWMILVILLKGQGKKKERRSRDKASSC